MRYFQKKVNQFGNGGVCFSEEDKELIYPGIVRDIVEKVSEVGCAKYACLYYDN